MTHAQFCSIAPYWLCVCGVCVCFVVRLTCIESSKHENVKTTPKLKRFSGCRFVAVRMVGDRDRSRSTSSARLRGQLAWCKHLTWKVCGTDLRHLGRKALPPKFGVFMNCPLCYDNMTECRERMPSEVPIVGSVLMLWRPIALYLLAKQQTL